MEKQGSRSSVNKPSEQTPPKAQPSNEDLRSRQMEDTLLASFSYAQKEYIIEHLYPELSKALVHFIAEAKRLNTIRERQEPV